MRTSQAIWAGLVVLALSSCAGTIKLDGITTEDIANSAVVKEQGSTMGVLFSGFTTPITGSKFTTILVSIDGKKVSQNANGREWRLVPGKHSLGIRCSHRYGRILDGGTGGIAADLIAGHTYQLESKAIGGLCNAELKDVTTP